jgi:hypothetical protein
MMMVLIKKRIEADPKRRSLACYARINREKSFLFSGKNKNKLGELREKYPLNERNI